MQNILLLISNILAFVSYPIYAHSILKGETRPHRTTRFVLFLITSLAAASLLVHGNTVAAWLPGIFAFCNFFILLLSFKFGMGGWSRTDIFVLIIALFGIVIWKLTKNPILALYSSIAADFTGVIPALIKTYRLPKTEVWTFYFLDVLAAIFNLFASNRWNIQDFSYPLYIVFIDGLMIIFILRPLANEKRKR